MQHAADFGVQASAIQLAFRGRAEAQRESRDEELEGIEYLMKKNKCTVFKGTGKFLCPVRSKSPAKTARSRFINT
jgi:pyruvate/2-oxoglutarate dehydrogenase complex dihydrolipoamide dehydrogenase (E3) component